MYIILKINRTAFKVLQNDPKRKYKGARKIIFYIKVIITTIKNRKIYLGHNCSIIYKAKDKEIYFYNDTVRYKFYNKNIIKKYLFVIENKVTDIINIKNEIIEIPLLLNSKKRFHTKNSNILLRDIINDLTKLYSLKIKYKTDYIKELTNYIETLNIPIIEQNIINKYKINHYNKSVYKTLVHGDLWKGNIVLSMDKNYILDWDDLTFKSFTYDIFYYYFQEYNTNFLNFDNNYYNIKKDVLPIINLLTIKLNISFTESEYDKYYFIFILERLLKRYDKKFYNSDVF